MALPLPVYDVAVIGGGTVGCAVARHLSLAGYRIVLVEKSHIASGASSGNSGIVHTGFDATEGTLEHSLIVRAGVQNKHTFTALGLPYKQVGCLVVAWSEEELAELPKIKARASHGIDVELLTREQLFAKEPHLNRDALGALFVPGETLIDPWLTPAVFAAHAAFAGATVLQQTEVLGAALSTDCDSSACSTALDGQREWLVSLSNGTQLKARAVVNCGGLFGDKVEALQDPSPSFEIKPRKGQFAVFEKRASAFLSSIVCPVPTERTKGVFLFPTVYGNVLVGPTAEDQSDRTTPARTTPSVVRRLVERAHYMIPALRSVEVVGSYAGLRPATQHKDYVIKASAEKPWITVGGIRSTGVTAACGIAEHVEELLRARIDVHPQRPPVQRPFSLAVLSHARPPTGLFEDAAVGGVKHGLAVDTTQSLAFVGDLGWMAVTHPIALFGWKDAGEAAGGPRSKL